MSPTDNHRPRPAEKQGFTKMPVSVECPHCGRAVTLSRKYLGTSMRCRDPKCGRRFTAAAPGGADASAPADTTDSGRNAVSGGKSADVPFAQVEDSVRRSAESSRTGTPAVRGGPAAGNGGKGDVSSSSGNSAERSQVSTKTRAVAKPPRKRPVSVALLAAAMAAFVAGWLAGTIRFSLPLPLLMPLAAGAAVGWAVAFAAGGWGSMPRWGLLASSVGVGCAAGLWSWATLFLWVKGDLHSFARQRLTPLALSSGGWRDRLDKEFSLTQGNFNFRTFLRLRSLREDESEREINEFASAMLRSMGGVTLQEWKKNDVVAASMSAQEPGFGEDTAAFEKWIQESLRKKMRNNARFEGGPLEPKGDLSYILMSLEIVLAGAAAVLVYLQAIGQLWGGVTHRTEEADSRLAEPSASRNR